MTQSLQTTLRRSWPTIVLTTLLFMSVAFGVSMTLPKEYGSTFSVLIVERGQNLDSFTAAKSAERLTLSLNQILTTTSFADQVRARLTYAGHAPDNDPLFAEDATTRRKEWLRRFTSRTYPSVGLLKISTFDEDRGNALVAATAFANVLVDHGAEYMGGGGNVMLKVVDAPLASDLPVRPNVLMNMAAAGIIGLFAATGFASLRKENAARTLQRQTAARAIAGQPSLVRAAEAMVQARAMPEPVTLPRERIERETEQAAPIRTQDASVASVPGQEQPVIWRMP